MTINEIIEEIARYREWVDRQPFGAPIDTEAYREHLITENLRMKEIERIANEES